MIRSRILLSLSISMVSSGPAVAEPGGLPASATPAAALSAPVNPPLAPSAIPVLTPVKIEILADLGSRTSKSGDTFPLRLAEPIMVDGAIAVQAGTSGMGEVVHAKKSGASGSSGELVLAARYLDLGGRQLRLRSMHLIRVGADNFNTALAVGVTVGLPALFINGHNVVVPSGSIAEAKTAEAFVVNEQPPVQAAGTEGAATPAPAATGQASTGNSEGENANAHP